MAIPPSGNLYCGGERIYGVVVTTVLRDCSGLQAGRELKGLAFLYRSHHMPQYTQVCRAAAVLLLIGTGLFALAVACIAVMAVFGLAIIQQVYTEGEQIVSYAWAGWTAAALLVPALLLVWFYFTVLTRVPGMAAATTGWVASAAFHLGLTFLFMTFLTGRIETGHSLMAMPLWILTGFAMVVSVYLAMACRKLSPPPLPPMPVAR